MSEMNKEKQAFERPYWDHDKHSDALAYERAAEMHMDKLENEIAVLKAELERINNAINVVISACENPEGISKLFKQALKSEAENISTGQKKEKE